MNKEGIINIYSKYKFFLFPLIIVIVTISIGYFVIYPQIGNVLSSQDKISEINRKTTSLNEKVKKLEKLDEEDLKDNLAVALKTLPQEADFANTLGIIQTLAAQYQFIIVNFQTSRNDDKSLKLSSYGVSLDLLGPKDLVERFIDSINTNFRLMRTGRLEINTPAGSEEATTLITVDVYFSSIPTTIGAVDAPLAELTQDDEERLSELSRSQPVVVEELIPQGPRGKPNPFE